MYQHGRCIIVLLTPLILYLIFKQYEVSERNKLRSMHWSSIAKKWRKKKRILWSKVNKRISDNQFRRMFCIDCKCFSLLCKRIIQSVGESKFKSGNRKNRWWQRRQRNKAITTFVICDGANDGIGGFSVVGVGDTLGILSSSSLGVEFIKEVMLP